MGNLLTSTSEVDRLVASRPVVMFSATYCSYCTLAKRILNDLDTDFLTIEVNKHPEGRKIAEQLSVVVKNNYVPQIFICGRLIGGCDDLRRMHSDGSLQTSLQQCCKGDVTCRS